MILRLKLCESDRMDKANRRHRMAVLANADGRELRRLWGMLGVDPVCTFVRGPETGLVALRGRIGGGGSPFNFGEATATRATVRLSDGTVGHAMMLGRDKTKVRLAAIIDALAQNPELAAEIDNRLIGPLRTRQLEEDKRMQAETAATRVNFFTLVRGED